MRSRIILFIVANIVWALLNWVPDWQSLLIGVFVSAFVAFLTGDLFPGRIKALFNPRRYLWALCYIPVFLWECLKANIDVAYRVLHPDLPIRPGIVKIKTNLKSDIALTFLANSITLTPGTMCMDINKEEGVLYIHWINVLDDSVEGATAIISAKFERILKGIFE
ncbi:MAG: Na+/H+ antiporter subunit E [Candidatus Omnitrophica bacterium]|nr:Na+/H+ antiporter subunit E [Candidatus Omnitrophota bacterium]